jgi:hypothetical protein
MEMKFVLTIEKSITFTMHQKCSYCHISNLHITCFKICDRGSIPVTGATYRVPWNTVPARIARRKGCEEV